jgi:transcriptional regulator with XRE-family HTH domain
MAREQESWTEYVQRITKGLPRKNMAEAAGIDPSGLSRWLNGKRPSAEKVVAFARGLHQSPIEALIAAGYIEAGEASGVIEIARSRSELSDLELLTELGDRLASRPPIREMNDDITRRLARPDDFNEGIEHPN